MAVRFSFVQDDTVQGIDVTVRAKEKNETVEALLSKLRTASEHSAYGRIFMEKYGIHLNDVIVVMRGGRYVTARTAESEHVIRDALTRVEEELDPVWFVRISQSEIINLKYVKRWDFVGGGIIQIEMQNNIICYASRRFASHIRDTLRKGRAKS